MINSRKLLAHSRPNVYRKLPR